MIEIRQFEHADLNDLYSISLATGLSGGDASHLYHDPKMPGHIYSAPYALLEPDLAFVITDVDGVAGYVVGTLDTVIWENRLEVEWWPSLRLHYANPDEVPIATHTVDQQRAYMIHHPSRTPSAVSEMYPAHIHMNLMPRVQRRGIGSKLLATWLDAVDQRGSAKIHIGTSRANVSAIQFWKKHHFEKVTHEHIPQTRTLWMGRKINTSDQTQ
jgi:GNAT superfamily N-acetyltransferase